MSEDISFDGENGVFGGGRREEIVPLSVVTAAEALLALNLIAVR
jgi:hypothetical protein